MSRVRGSRFESPTSSPSTSRPVTVIALLFTLPLAGHWPPDALRSGARGSNPRPALPINPYRTIRGKGIARPPNFSNLHNFGTERDTTNEHRMNSIDICSIYRPHIMLFCPISFRFQVREFWNIRGSNTFATNSTRVLVPFQRSLQEYD